MTEEEINILLEKYSKKGLDPEEDKKLTNHLLLNWIIDQNDPPVDFHKIYEERIKPKKTKSLNFNIYIKVAAAIFIILAASITLWKVNLKKQTNIEQTASLSDFKPATSAAILRLNNGKEINIENKNLDDIIYRIKQNSKASNEELEKEKNTYTVITQKGQQYSFTLSDGTKIWLNASSKIIFPEKFGNNERKIDVDGEVYLEVTKSNIPFIVQTKGIMTKVLGTSFNVNTYASQNPKVTLLTGLVEVTDDQQRSMLLSPGYSITKTTNALVKSKANLNQIIAWKNNLFYFVNDPIEKIVSELERWYNVDFKLDKKIDRHKLYNGIIDRNASIKDVIEILNFSTNYKITVEAHNLITIKQTD
jgi:transmembrane sensor